MDQEALINACKEYRYILVRTSRFHAGQVRDSLASSTQLLDFTHRYTRAAHFNPERFQLGEHAGETFWSHSKASRDQDLVVRQHYQAWTAGDRTQRNQELRHALHPALCLQVLDFQH